MFCTVVPEQGQPPMKTRPCAHQVATYPSRPPPQMVLRLTAPGRSRFNSCGECRNIGLRRPQPWYAHLQDQGEAKNRKNELSRPRDQQGEAHAFEVVARC